MDQLDIESTAKVIFFNPELSRDIVDSINKKSILVDREIEEQISIYKTQMLGELDDPYHIAALEEKVAMLENFLNVLKESHL